MKAGTTLNRSVERALALLSALGRGKATLTVLSAETGLPTPTVLRLVRTLQDSDFVRRLPSGELTLGPAMLRLGLMADANGPMHWIVQNAVIDLRDRLDETATFWVEDSLRRRCVAMAEGTKPVRWLGQVGQLSPIHRGAAGKTLLAFAHNTTQLLSALAAKLKAEKADPLPNEFAKQLEIILKQGIAMSESEFSSDAFGVAAPVFVGDTLLGALAVSIPISRLRPGMREELVNACCEVARNSGDLSLSNQRRPNART